MIISYHPLTYDIDADEPILNQLHDLGVAIGSFKKQEDGNMIAQGFYFKPVRVKLTPAQFCALLSELHNL